VSSAAIPHGFSGDVTRAGNSGDEVLGRLYAVASLGEFVAQMLRTLSSGILRAAANDVPTYEINSSISAFVCGSSANAIAVVRSKVKMEAKSWRMKSTCRFGRDAQSSHSIGSQLITWALMRFMKPASGSEW
jgi:hypothetical protein